MEEKITDYDFHCHAHTEHAPTEPYIPIRYTELCLTMRHVIFQSTVHSSLVLRFYTYTYTTT